MFVQVGMAQLRVGEQRVTDRYGAEGLGLCRAVLTEGQSVEASARLRGAASDRDVWFWAKLFRRCLDVLAAAFGFATSTYCRPPWQDRGGLKEAILIVRGGNKTAPRNFAAKLIPKGGTRWRGADFPEPNKPAQPPKKTPQDLSSLRY